MFEGGVIVPDLTGEVTGRGILDRPDDEPGVDPAEPGVEPPEPVDVIDDVGRADLVGLPSCPLSISHRR
jgi:hypothetical protein